MVGLIGLNSSGLPALPNRFLPLNASPLQQQALAAGGFVPAYAPAGPLPPDQTPSADQALAAAGGGRLSAGAAPVTPLLHGGGAEPTGPTARMTFPDLVSTLNLARAGLGGDFANIGQAISNGVYGIGQALASPFLQLTGAAGGGQGAPPAAAVAPSLLPGPSLDPAFANTSGVLNPTWRDPSQA